MTDKHTPGPWNVAGLTITADAGNPVQPIARIVLFLPELAHQTEANARLIAAAPELLAALEITVQFGLALIEMKAGDKWMLQAIMADVEKARAAIAKARGEA